MASGLRLQWPPGRACPEELCAVLAHEYAHASRRDNLRQVLLWWLTLAWTKKRRQRLMVDYSCSSEQACDEAASHAAGSPGILICLLDRLWPAADVARSGQQATFQGLDVQERIAALRHPSSEPLTLAWVFLAGLWVLSMALFTGISHRLVELLTLG